MNAEKLITTRTAAITRSKTPQSGIAKKAKCSQSYVSKYAHALRVPDYVHHAIEKVLRVKTAIVPPVSYAERMKTRAATAKMSKGRAKRLRHQKDVPQTARRVAKAAPKPNGTHVPMKTISDASFDEPGVLAAFRTFADTISARLKEFEADIRADERAKIRERFEIHLNPNGHPYGEAAAES